VTSERERGSDALLEILRTEGVSHVFGNPGSTELPLIDALAGVDDIEYVLGLQEATVVGMADGYAQATGRPAFLNLHTSAGIGNAVGNLTNARANGTPLVVTAGQQDYRHIVTDPLLAGDLTGLAAATVKWAHEVRTPGELGTVMRRAFNDAESAPRAPVFVSLPMNLLDEGPALVPPKSSIDRRSVCGSLPELAQLLTECAPGQLAIVAGTEVAHYGATEALATLAETLGAKVYATPLAGAHVFPVGHPLFAGALAPLGAAVAGALAAFRRVFFVGNQGFKTYPYSPVDAVPSTVELLHLAPDPHALGRTHPVRLGVTGDPRASLEALLPLVQAKVDAEGGAAALRDARAAQVTAREKADADADAVATEVPMALPALGKAMFAALPQDVVVVDESITSGGAIRPFHRTSKDGRFFFCQGGGLGWGMPAATGVSLGYGREFVLCVVGDGSAMYSPQALWTAANLDLPVLFAVVNNRQYLILKNYLRRMGGNASTTGRMVGMDLVEPAIDYVALARSMGVEADRVENAGEVGDAVRAAHDRGRPYLLDLPIAAP
jgi:benzoylformate decarboxylase